MSYFFHNFLKSISLLSFIFFVSMSAHSQIHFVFIILLVVRSCKRWQAAFNLIYSTIVAEGQRRSGILISHLFLKYSWCLWMVISFSFDLLSPLSWLNWVFLSVYPSIYLFVWHLPIQIKNLVAVFFSVCLLIWMFFCSLSPYLVPWRRLFLLHVSVHILVRSNNWHLLPHTCP